MRQHPISSLFTLARAALPRRARRYKPFVAAALAAAAIMAKAPDAEAAGCGLPYVDVWNSTDPANYVLVATVETIRTAQSGAQHYNYTSSSGHPSGVNLGSYISNLWVHQHSTTGATSRLVRVQESPWGAWRTNCSCSSRNSSMSGWI